MSGSRVAKSGFFVPEGGTLPPDAPSYIERPADQELYERALAGDYCYVLTPRQMGKSSLMARTASRLRSRARCAIVDLTQTGADAASFEQWLYGIASDVHKGLGRQSDFDAWWQAHAGFTPVKRVAEFLEEIANEDRPTVIFIDEIERTLAVRSSDQLFAVIRACHNARATKPAFAKLSFVLLGVATPNQLIRDPKQTPFNVGRRIELTDFTPEEANHFAAGLDADPERGAQLLERVLYWTGGHPYLTQAVCSALVEGGGGDADAVVAELFFSKGASRDEVNLARTGQQITARDGYLKARLKLYLQVRRGEHVLDQPALPAHATLKLSGVVQSVDGELRVRNRIYEQVFTARWAKAALPTESYRRVAITATIALLLASWGLDWFVARSNTEALRLAREDSAVAIQAYQTLSRLPGFKRRADELLAQYWERRPGVDRDVELLYRLRAVAAKDTEARRADAQKLIGSDYEALMMSYRGFSQGVLSPRGELLLSYGGPARLWRTQSGQPLTAILGPEDTVAAAFTPDGNIAITGSRRGIVRFWKPDSGQQIAMLSAASGSLATLAISPDGEYVLTGGDTTQLWSAASRKQFLELHFTIFVNDVPWFESRSEFLHRVHRALKCDFCHTKAWTSPRTSPVSIPNTQNCTLCHWASHSAKVAFSADGSRVLTIGGSDGRTAQVWDAKTGCRVTPPLKHNGTIYGAAFSPDGMMVVTAGSNLARVWRADTGQPVGAPMHHGGEVYAVAFSPTAKLVATGSSDGYARLWWAESGKPHGPPLRIGIGVGALVFNPDGKILATGCIDGTLRLWRVDSAQQVGPVLGRGNGALFTVVFTPDGRYILSTGGVAARLWRADLENLPNRSTLTGDPKSLLEEWEKKLALRFDETGKVVPRY